jgi:hypothetical protein
VPTKAATAPKAPVTAAAAKATANCSGLFNELPNVVTNNRDALFEFMERKRTALLMMFSQGKPWGKCRSEYRCGQLTSGE